MRIDSVLRELREGKIYDLSQANFRGIPAGETQQPGFSYILYRRHSDEYSPNQRRTQASGAIFMTDHVGTHIDAICHQSYDLEFFPATKVDRSVETQTGFTKQGAETINPIIRMGILLDVAAYKGADALPASYLITESDLAGCAHHEGVTPEPGDAVLIRTGNGKFWSDAPRYLQRSGLDKNSARWLAGRSISLLGCDTSSPDSLTYVDPDTGDSRFAHIVLLAKGGVHIVENMFLEEISQARCYRFIFIGLPIKIVGATGAPIRPIAIA